MTSLLWAACFLSLSSLQQLMRQERESKESENLAIDPNRCAGSCERLNPKKTLSRGHEGREGGCSEKFLWDGKPSRMIIAEVAMLLEERPEVLATLSGELLRRGVRDKGGRGRRNLKWHPMQLSSRHEINFFGGHNFEKIFHGNDVHKFRNLRTTSLGKLTGREEGDEPFRDQRSCQINICWTRGHSEWESKRGGRKGGKGGHSWPCQEDKNLISAVRRECGQMQERTSWLSLLPFECYSILHHLVGRQDTFAILFDRAETIGIMSAGEEEQQDSPDDNREHLKSSSRISRTDTCRRSAQKWYSCTENLSSFRWELADSSLLLPLLLPLWDQEQLDAMAPEWLGRQECDLLCLSNHKNTLQ